MGDKFRGWQFAVAGIVALLIVAVFVPERVSSILSMAARFVVAAYIGYWVDRVTCYYSRPHTLEGRDQVLATLRRGIVQGAALIGAGMSL